MSDNLTARRDILPKPWPLSPTLAESAFSQPTSPGEIYDRNFGKTSDKVSAIGLGGYHMGVPKDEQEGIRIVRTAIDRGINFLDNCWDYNDGKSEIRMGKALRDGYRQKVFLMTKFDGRTKESPAEQIDESLQRLQTDHLDLMQFHENIRMEDPDRFFAGGAWRPCSKPKSRQDSLYRIYRP